MKRLVPYVSLGYLALILIWGSTWIAIKVSVGETPFLMAAIRFFLAGFLLIGYQKLRGRAIFPGKADRKVVIALGLGNFFVGYGFTYWGMQYVDSNITSILWATLPVMIALFAHGMLTDEKITGSSIFSLIGALIGTLLIFEIQGQGFDPVTAKGMLMILLSVAAAAYPNVLFKRNGTHLDTVATNAAAMLIGAPLLLLTGLLTDPWRNIQLDLLSLGATTYLAVFGSAIGFTLYFWLLKHVSVVKMSYTTFLIPILASIWGWIILGEGLSRSAALGAVIILLSIGLPELRKAKRVAVATPDD